uniref:Protein containing CH and Filamin domain n=1 Tax=Rhipicephalus zambeziensis TaxID=60191 RepID=A0A224Y451_9ACAR
MPKEANMRKIHFVIYVRHGMRKPDILSVMENYRQTTLSRLTAWCLWFGHFILHPTSAWRSSTLWHKVQLFFCYILSSIFVGYHEKKTLLDWVRSRVKNYPVPDNFSSGWKDGILLCALLDSMYPGSCPRYDLLNADNCLSNAQLAFFLLEKHTPIRPEITAEELAEGSPSIEKAVRAIVSRLKVISAKAQLQQALGKRPSIKDDGGDDSSSLVARKNCFAKGMGLILAVRGRKASFNVFTKSTSNFCIVVEIRGPDNTVCKEIITNKSPRRKVTASSREADKSAPDGAGQDDKKILIEYDIQPGMVAVKYTPLLKGKHQLSIIWHGQHLAGSPFTVNVDDSTDYADDLLLQRQDSADSQSSEKDYPAPASPTSAAQLKGKVKRRRVLRRIVNVNGQDIVIEGDDKDKLFEVLRSLSSNVFRQNGSDYSSGREKRTIMSADGTRVAKPFFSPLSSPESSPDTYSCVDYGSKSLWERSKHVPSKLAMPEIIVSSCSPHASEEERTPEVVAEASAERRCPDALGGRASPNVSLSGRASPCGTVSPSGTITPSGRVSPSGTITPSGRVSPCGRTSPSTFPEVSELDELSSATLNSSSEGSSAARALFVSDMLHQETSVSYTETPHELEAAAHLSSLGEAGDVTFVGAESPALNDDLPDCTGHKQLERTLSIISEESDKPPSDQLEPPESADVADKLDTPPSYDDTVVEADDAPEPSQQQPDETAFGNRPVPSERLSRMSVLERARSLESAFPQQSPIQRHLSQYDVSSSQQAPLSKLDELYLDTVKLKQFFTENFKKTIQTSSTTHTFTSSSDRDEFLSVRDMVKVWEHRQSLSPCGSPEQVSLRGDASNGRQGVDRRFRVTQVAASGKENEPDLVKDAILPQAARRQASLDSGVGSSGQSSEDKGTRGIDKSPSSSSC